MDKVLIALRVRMPPLLWRWIGATLLVAMLAGTAGLLRFEHVCRATCGPPVRGIYTIIPGKKEALQSGAILAGLLLYLGLLVAQGFVLRRYLRGGLVLFLCLPAVALTIYATLVVVTIAPSRTDVEETGWELLYLGSAVLVVSLAGAGLGVAQRRLLDPGGQASVGFVRETAKSWAKGWAIFAYAGFLGAVPTLVVGWVVCWLGIAYLTGREVLRVIGRGVAGSSELIEVA